MAGNNKKRRSKTEYDKFKKNEPDYIASIAKKTVKKRKDWVWWLVALLVVSTSIYFVVDYMFDSRVELTEEGKLDKLTAVEAVEQMFDENKEWVRNDLTQEEFDQVNQKVEDLADSSEKAKIKSLLAESKEQLESKLAGEAIVDGLKTKNGDVNVDLGRDDLLENLDDFPHNYNPDYVLELKAKYTEITKVIIQAEDLQERIRALDVDMDKTLDKTELDEINKQVEALPFSERKSQLTYDMKALFQDYEEQQEELKLQRAEEERQRQIEEKRRKEEEAIRQAEQERQAEYEREENARLERQREQERVKAEEEKRILDELENYNKGNSNNNNSNNNNSNNNNSNNNNSNNNNSNNNNSNNNNDTWESRESTPVEPESSTTPPESSAVNESQEESDTSVQGVDGNTE